VSASDSGVALLDVNVLVALFDPDHVHHELAHDWFADQKALGWATCPMTENGCIRVLTNPAYVAPPHRAHEIVERLRVFQRSGGHYFWPDTVSLADPSVFNAEFISGHRQVTDIYLLGVAKQAGGRLATFDRTIPVGAVKGATKKTLALITLVPEK
jgi:toxin-antitoxin system PIN domain toxin